MLALFSLSAWVWLWRYRYQPDRLKPALVFLVITELLHGLGMTAGFPLLALGR